MEANRTAYEAAMVVHLGQQAMAASLAVRPTHEEATSTCMAASTSSLRAGDAEHMHD